MSVQGNAGGNDRSAGSLKSTLLPENLASAKGAQTAQGDTVFGTQRP